MDNSKIVSGADPGEVKDFSSLVRFEEFEKIYNKKYSICQIYKWFRERAFPYYQITENDIYVDLDEVQKYLGPIPGDSQEPKVISIFDNNNKD